MTMLKINSDSISVDDLVEYLTELKIKAQEEWEYFGRAAGRNELLQELLDEIERNR